MNSKAASDELLIKAIEEKNIAAFEELYDRLYPAALAVAYRVVGDRQLAEDVIQETFLALWRQAESFRPGLGTARTWLLSIARRRAIDIHRGRAFTTQSLPPDELIVEGYHDVGQGVVQPLDRERIRKTVEFLEEMAEFQLPPSVQEQLAKLMDKNTEDQLSKDEQKELQALVEFSESVSIMKGRAKLLLHQTR